MIAPSAYYIVREPDLPMVPVDPGDPEGPQRLAPGYVIVHSWATGSPVTTRYVVHSSPSADPIGAAETALSKAEIASNGRYDGAAVRASFPASVADRVLWATWERIVEGETVRGRSPIAAVPNDATVVESDQIPHVWVGQEVG